MTETRDSSLRARRRLGALALAGLALTAQTLGCDDGSETTTGTTMTTGGTGGTTGGTGGTTGGTGGTGGTTGGTGGTTGGTGGTMSPTAEITACATMGGNFNQPYDATPSPDSQIFYFTGVVADDMAGTYEPAVFRLPCGNTATVIASGDPLSSPFGVATSTDGQTLYIADAASEDETGTMKGAIFSMPEDGGAPAALAGTVGYQPRGLEVGQQGASDTIYFSGIDPSDGEPGLFESTTGGGVSVVAKGAPFVDPSGVAIAADGTIYVADTGGSEGQTASVIQVTGGTATVFVSDLTVGFPAGIALLTGDKTVLVSGIDPVTGGAVVLAIDVDSKAITSYNQGIENNTESAGLHRSKLGDTFAWADSTAGGTGMVYRVEFK